MRTLQSKKCKYFYDKFWLICNAPLPDTDTHKLKRYRAKAVFLWIYVFTPICRQRLPLENTLDLCQPYKTERFYEYSTNLICNAPLPDIDTHKKRRDRVKAVFFHGFLYSPTHLQAEVGVEYVAIDLTHDASNRHS
ncbi:hypothetical protein CDAR_542231 [Caerostris darwini]|uniref:Uncharacterized protein n=1 Tax=Caerostris darwini TaxID=1538125 RepID=A0AAV4PF24_9ARAC|nr:hypothetical protein CDAR_542231 [Caerostris darwini]